MFFLCHNSVPVCAKRHIIRAQLCKVKHFSYPANFCTYEIRNYPIWKGAKGRKSVTQMPVRASLLVMERKETQDNFIACAPLFCRTFTPQTRTEQFFPFSLKIFLFCLTFFTICADIFYYKLCNACYKLDNTCYKLCNTCYKLCNKLFLIGKGKISDRKEELSWRKGKNISRVV